MDCATAGIGSGSPQDPDPDSAVVNGSSANGNIITKTTSLYKRPVVWDYSDRLTVACACVNHFSIINRGPNDEHWF